MLQPMCPAQQNFSWDKTSRSWGFCPCSMAYLSFSQPGALPAEVQRLACGLLSKRCLGFAGCAQKELWPPQDDCPQLLRCPDKHPPIVPPRKWLQTSHCSLMRSRTVFTPSSLNKEAACEVSDSPTNLTRLLPTANEIPLLPPGLGDSTPTSAGREDGRFVLQPWQPHLGQGVDVRVMMWAGTAPAL